MSDEICFTKVFLSKFPLIVKSTIDGLIGNGYTTKELLLLLDLAEDLPQMSDISMAQKSVLRRILTEFQKFNKEVNDEFDRRVAVGLRDGSASVVSNDVNSGSNGPQVHESVHRCDDNSAIGSTVGDSMPSTETTITDSSSDTTSAQSVPSLTTTDDNHSSMSSSEAEAIASMSPITTVTVADSSDDSEEVSFSLKCGTDRRRKRQRISMPAMSSNEDTSDGQSSEETRKRLKDEGVYYVCRAKPMAKMPKKYSLVDPQFVMFGTFKTSASAVKFTRSEIIIEDVSTNSEDVEHRYDIEIRFKEIQKLMFLSDPTLPLVFIKPSKEANDKRIQRLLFFGNTSDGSKFDVNSDDKREKYIKLGFSGKVVDRLSRVLRQYCYVKQVEVVWSPL